MEPGELAAPTRSLGHVMASGQNFPSPGLSKLRVFGAYCLSYILDGQAYYRDANGLQYDNLRPGDMILVFPALAHQYGARPGGRWSEFWIAFEGPIFELWERQGILDPHHPILRGIKPIDEWLVRLKSVLGYPRRMGGTSLTEIARLQLVLAEAIASASEAKELSTEDFNWVARACAAVESDLNGPVGLPDIASQLGMTYVSFRRQFLKLVGMSPGKYRRRHLIREACQIIEHEHLTNRQIAARLGFTDEFHFSRQFHEITGRWPKEYRQLCSRSAGLDKTESSMPSKRGHSRGLVQQAERLSGQARSRGSKKNVSAVKKTNNV